MTETVCQ